MFGLERTSITFSASIVNNALRCLRSWNDWKKSFLCVAVTFTFSDYVRNAASLWCSVPLKRLFHNSHPNGMRIRERSCFFPFFLESPHSHKERKEWGSEHKKITTHLT